MLQRTAAIVCSECRVARCFSFLFREKASRLLNMAISPRRKFGSETGVAPNSSPAQHFENLDPYTSSLLLGESGRCFRSLHVIRGSWERPVKFQPKMRFRRGYSSAGGGGRKLPVINPARFWSKTPALIGVQLLKRIQKCRDQTVTAILRYLFSNVNYFSLSSLTISKN